MKMNKIQFKAMAVLTELSSPDLDRRCADTLAAHRPRRQADMVDRVWRKVGQKVLVARWRDRHVDVLAVERVVVVELVALDALARVLRRIPRQLDHVRRQRLAL